MGFTIHVAFHIWGHVFLIIGYLGLVSFHFYYPITLAYVTSRVLRPPWGRGIRCRLWQSLLGQVMRSGWHLDIVMLLLLGVASLMCRTDSVVFGLPGSWVWRWLTWCHLILLTYRTSGATLGAYPTSFGGLWTLADLHDHYHLPDAHWDMDMIVTS